MVKVLCWWSRYFFGDQCIFLVTKELCWRSRCTAGDKTTKWGHDREKGSEIKRMIGIDNDVDTDDCPQEINMLDLSAVERQMALNEV